MGSGPLNSHKVVVFNGNSTIKNKWEGIKQEHSGRENEKNKDTWKISKETESGEIEWNCPFKSKENLLKEWNCLFKSEENLLKRVKLSL